MIQQNNIKNIEKIKYLVLFKDKYNNTYYLHLDYNSNILDIKTFKFFNLIKGFSLKINTIKIFDYNLINEKNIISNNFFSLEKKNGLHSNNNYNGLKSNGLNLNGLNFHSIKDKLKTIFNIRIYDIKNNIEVKNWL
jgi:hypothetical protein